MWFTAFVSLVLLHLQEAQNLEYFRTEFLDGASKSVRLRWTDPRKSPDGRTIEFEYRAPGSGWIGLGFSPSGGMNGADLMATWRDAEGSPRILDGHGVGHAVLEDKIQDYRLLEHVREGAWTTVRFSRALDTCDDKDFVITGDTLQVIFAHSNASDFDRRPYHGSFSRGTRSLRLLDPSPSPSQAPSPGTRSVDVTMPPHRIPGSRTTYWCHLRPGPQTSVKQHITGYAPILNRTALRFLHHISLSGCHSSPEHRQYLTDFIRQFPDGAPCFDHPEMQRLCFMPSFVWTVGGEGLAFPSEAGVPVPPLDGGGPLFYKLEIHYDNPDLLSRLPEDDSGLRLFLTDALRLNDLGTVIVGSDVDYSIVVPPGRERVRTVGHCAAACTHAGLPPSGVRIFASLLHGHLISHSIRVRHWRDGRELPPIDSDSSYDFNYQNFRVFDRQERRLMPGDHVAVECEYSSVDRNVSTVGGWETSREMCQVFLLLYPYTPGNVWKCVSTIAPEDMDRMLGIPSGQEVFNHQMRYDYFLVDRVKGPSGNDARLSEFLDVTRGWSGFDYGALQESYTAVPKRVICTDAHDQALGGAGLFANYPNASAWSAPERNCPGA